MAWFNRGRRASANANFRGTEASPTGQHCERAYIDANLKTRPSHTDPLLVQFQACAFAHPSQSRRPQAPGHVTGRRPPFLKLDLSVLIARAGLPSAAISRCSSPVDEDAAARGLALYNRWLYGRLPHSGGAAWRHTRGYLRALRR